MSEQRSRSRDLILLLIADAISRRNAMIAEANRQLDAGGWLFDWGVLFRGVDSEVEALVAEIDALDGLEVNRG